MHKTLNHNSSILIQIGLHVLLGYLVYAIGFFSKVYFYGAFAYFIVKILSESNARKTQAVLMACAYFTGAEVIFRMTGAGIFYEASKYFVILFVLIGIAFNGISNRSYPFIIYLFLLVPSIVIVSFQVSLDSELRKGIAFVLSGPVCLGIAALYCYDKKITMQQFLSVLQYVALPVVTLTVYLFLYTPSIKDVVTGTASNFATSGGFGPNQVSTTLGLGMFVYCINFFVNSQTFFLKIINITLFALISYRGIVTFSRGGVLTAVLMIICFLLIFYWYLPKRKKTALISYILALLAISAVTWVVSSSQTSGLIDKRYANEDKSGREKSDVSAGRLDLFIEEMEGFIEEPFIGVGASGMKEERIRSGSQTLATHNEIGRLLSEHGFLGIIILLILILQPFIFRFKNRRNVFFYAFLVFWFATINHSAMRIAAPGFIYGLAFLNIINEKKRPLYRQRIS